MRPTGLRRDSKRASWSSEMHSPRTALGSQASRWHCVGTDAALQLHHIEPPGPTKVRQGIAHRPMSPDSSTSSICASARHRSRALKP